MMLANYKLLAVIAVTFIVFVGLFSHSSDVEYQWTRITNNAPNTPPPDGPVAGGIPLRIMFLGASVTRGEVSTGDRGYRKYLRDTLTSLGNPVNSVGFNRFGDWEDNDVEGYGANRIRQLKVHATQAVPVLQPNLVLIQLGTSDCFQNDDPLNIISRMKELVYYLLEASPNATVILSTLATTPNTDVEPCMLSANAQIRQVAADLMREKRKVALAEMHYDQGLLRRPRPEDIGGDKIHPTDEGYLMMGDAFMDKIREVEQKGFLQAPVDVGIPDER